MTDEQISFFHVNVTLIKVLEDMSQPCAILGSQERISTSGGLVACWKFLVGASCVNKEEESAGQPSGPANTLPTFD